MFCLLTFLDDFRGAKVSCRQGPELSSEQRLELFEVSLDLTSEEVIGSVFKFFLRQQGTAGEFFPCCEHDGYCGWTDCTYLNVGVTESESLIL